ncbi:MAG: YdcF family protein [Treponema sp.]|nr:YdcF family protein [Treponema sp.]
MKKNPLKILKSAFEKILPLILNANALILKTLLKILQKTKSILKKLILPVAILACISVITIIAINAYMILSTKDLIHTDYADVPERYVAIVPGAMVYKNNVISHVYRDRIAGGMELLKNGTVQKVLVSGDHGRKDYDEENAARLYIRKIYKADENLIFMDHAGFSTYETMYRARDVFCVKDAVIVTQRFHLYRSLYIAKKLGINAVGYDAPELNRFRKALHLKWEIRESLARVKTFFLVLFNAQPTYLGEEIPITGSGYKTWD